MPKEQSNETTPRPRRLYNDELRIRRFFGDHGAGYTTHQITVDVFGYSSPRRPKRPPL